MKQGRVTAAAPERPKWPKGPGLKRRSGPLLDCYWVGSLDSNFLGNQGLFIQLHKRLNFLQRLQQQPSLDAEMVADFLGPRRRHGVRETGTLEHGCCWET